MKIISVIPARGGSKGLPGKNIIPLCGKPLIVYTIEQSLSSKLIDQTVVSTNNKKIKEISIKHSVKVIDRPAKLATDKASIESCISHIIRFIEADLVVLLQPTSPLRRIKTIDSAIKLFVDNFKRYDSLIPLYEIEGKIGKIHKNRFIPNYKIGSRRQDLEKLYKECGTIFIFKTSVIQKQEFFGKRILPFVITNYDESIDINTHNDLKLAEFFLKMKNQK